MTTYCIWTHPLHGTVTVKDGWSWPGFFFAGLWAVAKGLWLVTSVVVAFWLVLAVVLSAFPVMGALVWPIGLALKLLFGATGNKLREIKLRDHGYVLAAKVRAYNKSDALARYIRGTPPPLPR